MNTAGPTPITLSGVVPVVPTVFTDDEELDLEGLRRVLDFLVDGGVDGVCLLANFAEQFSLEDDERDLLARTAIEHVAGRVPVIVTATHFSTRIARARARAAQDLGADMVMLMPPFFGSTLAVAGAAVVAHFARVSDGLDIPIMVQDAPMSTTPLPANLIVELVRQVPTVTHAKIEVPNAADKLETLRHALGDALTGPFDGEESVSLLADLDAGATGTMCSSLVPEQLGAIVRDYRAGRQDAARDAWEGVLPLISFENRQCGLRAQKIVLAEGGVIRSDRTRAPLGPVAPRTRERLLDLARRRDVLALRWAR
jgi:4-hydroxy-tetrahydrodipicolinate synthase